MSGRSALRTGTLLGALSAVILLSSGARAEEPYAVPEELRKPPSLPDDADATRVRSIGLSSAIQIAVQQNLGIVLAREQSRSADHAIRAAWGRMFEPTLNAQVNHSTATSPPQISLLQNGDTALQLNTQTANWNLGVSQTLATGAQVSLGFNNLHTLYNPSGGSPPIYNSTLGLQVVQPLLRGFAFDMDVPRADVLRARFASVRAKDGVRLAIIQTVHATDDAYWDLVAALKNYEVQRESLRLADEQRVLTERQIAAGVLAPSDLISAESTQAQRQLALLQAETTIGSSTDALRHVLNLPRDEWSQPILPVDAPQFLEKEVGFDSALSVAMRNRPEIAQQSLDVDRAKLDVRVAKTNRLPEVDAVVSYGLTGQQVAYSDTLTQLFKAEVPAWTAGVNVTWAPLMQAATAQVGVLKAAQGVQQAQLDQAKIDLYAELRDDLRQLALGAKQVRAAAKFRELAHRALDAEQRKFLNSQSTNFFVAQRQADLAVARQAELTALIAHRKAETSLAAAMGILLSERGVELDAPQ